MSILSVSSASHRAWSKTVDQANTQATVLHATVCGNEGIGTSGILRAAPGQGYAVLKRLFDIVFSSIALILLMPALVFIAGLIKSTSPGPVLFKQLRYGKGRKLFTILKFRTMTCDPLGQEGGVRQASEINDRITPVGKFLRRTSLDELPQLWNVLMGDMSIVGPRPHAPLTVIDGRMYEELVEDYELRHSVRPGLTGLSQVTGLQGPIPDAAAAEARFATDILYVETATMATDLLIVLKTCRQELFSRKSC